MAKTRGGSVQCRCSRRVPCLIIYVPGDHRPPFIVLLKLSGACTAPENSDEQKGNWAMPRRVARGQNIWLASSLGATVARLSFQSEKKVGSKEQEVNVSSAGIATDLLKVFARK